MLTKRFISVIALLLAAVMLLSFAACGTPKEDEKPEDTAEAAAPTDEPEATEAPEDTQAPSAATDVIVADDGTVSWELDLDNDGQPDRFVLNLDRLEKEGFDECWVEFANGKKDTIGYFNGELPNGRIGAFGVANVDGRDYLLYHRPRWENGKYDDLFVLYTSDEEYGYIKEDSLGGAVFEAPVSRPVEQIDEETVLDNVDTLNMLWENSRLLYTTETEILGLGLYQRSDGAKKALDGMEYFVAPNCEDAETYYYVETLQRLDKDFGLDEGLTAQQKLRLVNKALAEIYDELMLDDDGFIALAWPVAEDVTALYGGTVSRESGTVEHTEDGIDVCFRREPEDLDDEFMYVRFNYADGWKADYIIYSPARPEYYDYELVERDIYEIADKHYTYNVAASGEEEAVLAAMQYIADMLIELPEGSHIRCSEATPYNVLRNDNYTEDAVYNGYIAVLPDDYFTMSFMFREYSHGVCPEEGEMYLRYLLGVFAVVEGVNADGTYKVIISIPFATDDDDV